MRPRLWRMPTSPVVRIERKLSGPTPSSMDSQSRILETGPTARCGFLAYSSCSTHRRAASFGPDVIYIFRQQRGQFEFNDSPAAVHQPLRQIRRDVAGTVVAEQARL